MLAVTGQLQIVRENNEMQAKELNEVGHVPALSRPGMASAGAPAHDVRFSPPLQDKEKLQKLGAEVKELRAALSAEKDACNLASEELQVRGRLSADTPHACTIPCAATAGEWKRCGAHCQQRLCGPTYCRSAQVCRTRREEMEKELEAQQATNHQLVERIVAMKVEQVGWGRRWAPRCWPGTRAGSQGFPLAFLRSVGSELE